MFGGVPIAHAFDTENGQHVPVGYGKGKLILKILERQLGQETMLRSMRRFFADHVKGEPAEWAEFEAAVSKESGMDYRWFFSQWLERKGLPILSLSSVTSRREGQGYIIEADIVQSGIPYRLSLPVLLEAAEGTPVGATILADGRTTHFVLRSSAPPTRLRLDPQGIVPFSAPLPATPINPTLYNFAP